MGHAVVWDVDRSAELARVPISGKDRFGQFLSVAFAPDGQTFAAAGLDGQARTAGEFATVKCWLIFRTKPQS